MANADQPKGLSPYGAVLRVTPYTAGAAIYPGAPVAMSADGKLDASAGDMLIGVALSYASADGAEVLVADHPDQLFEIQADDASISSVDAYGGNFDMVGATTGNSTYKRSDAELDGDTADAHSAADNPLKLIRIVPAPNNAFGANARCIVKLNKHQLGNGAVSAAV